MTQACIDTFVTLARFHNDLNAEQLKRVHRFFYRVAFKQDQTVMLFRLDIIALFYKIIKGPEGLDPKGPMFREWEELVRQILKKLIKKMDQRPELAVELLFSKIHSTTFYLEYGYEKQTTALNPKVPAALEVRGSMTLEEQIGVVVAILFDDHMDYIQWVVRTLSKSADERQSWEAEATARNTGSQNQSEGSVDQVELQSPASKAPSIVIQPSSEEIRIAMFKNAKLRLLMTLSGFEPLGETDEPDGNWIIPSPLTSAQLRYTHDIIERHSQDPKFQYGEEDPIPAEEMLRRKPTEMPKRAEYDDDSEGDGIVSDGQGEEEFLFPAGGPTNSVVPRKSALDVLKQRRRRRRPDSDEEGGLDDGTREARRKARAEADLERRRGIKSAQFVQDSDDESNEERDRSFFAGEAARRRAQKERVAEALSAGRIVGRMEGEKIKPAVESRKKRKTESEAEKESKKMKSSSDVSEEDSDLDMDQASSPPARRAVSVSSTDSEVEEDTPLSSPPHVAAVKQTAVEASPEVSTQSSLSDRGENISKLAIDEYKGDERISDDEEDGPVAASGRRRVRAAVFDDSDD